MSACVWCVEIAPMRARVGARSHLGLSILVSGVVQSCAVIKKHPH